MSPGDEAGIGKELAITGTDMEFFVKAIFPGEESDIVVNAIDFTKRSTGYLNVKVPKEIVEGLARIRLVDVSGKEALLPEILLKAQAEGEWVLTETAVWTGSHDLEGWGNNFMIKASWFEDIELEVGQTIKLYFTQYNDWNQFNFNTGEWGALNIPEVGGSNLTSDFLGGTDVTEFEFELTSDLLPWFVNGDSWGTGNAVIINGEGFIFTKVSIIRGVFVEGGGEDTQVTLWEGTTPTVDWSASATIYLESEMLDELVAGKTIGFNFNNLGSAQVRIMGTWWTELPSCQADYNSEWGVIDFADDVTSYEFVLTQADIDILVEQGGFVFGGGNMQITKIYVY